MPPLVQDGRREASEYEEDSSSPVVLPLAVDEAAEVPTPTRRSSSVPRALPPLSCRHRRGRRRHHHHCRRCDRGTLLLLLRRMPLAFFLVPCGLLFLLPRAATARADWIDPETPYEARTTQPYNTRLKPLPSQAPTTVQQHQQQLKQQQQQAQQAARRRSVPTPAPTETMEPTLSHQPSSKPSGSPTDLPTFVPHEYVLVFSDEFNTPNRTFEDGVDPRWTALDKNDYTNGALHYYSPLNVQTSDDGHLVIRSEAASTDIVGFDDVKLQKTRSVKHFRSAMIQSWNKFCFTGGIIEAQATMPGKSSVGGLWPAFWLLGNLARHTYVGSSEHIWPWSSVNCTKKSGWAQKISGCHRVAHYGMQSRVGRGAPEIDIFEVQPGNIKANTGNFLKTMVGQPFMSSSFQVAPGRPANRPGPGEWPGPGQWYEGIKGGRNTSVNILFYGDYNHFLNDVHPAQEDYWSDAISMNRQLNEDHFAQPHVYRLEWDVPTKTRDGYLHWFLDGELVFALNGTGIRKAGLGSEISSEPSYILFNTAISTQWGFPSVCPVNCPCETYNCQSDEWQELCGFSEGFCDMMKAKESPQYKIDWVRVYQNPDDPTQKVGCSTPERPTRRWIEAHEALYKTANDARPLKDVPQGRGACVPGSMGISPASCGGPRQGRCTSGRVCECQDGFTGPNCMARTGEDPIPYDQPDKIRDVGFVPPLLGPSFLIGALVGLSMLLVAVTQCRHRLDRWMPIPEEQRKLIKLSGFQDDRPNRNSIETGSYNQY